MVRVTALVALALTAWGMPRTAISNEGCATSVPEHVRISDCRIASALQGGLVRSPSLRTLVARLAELKGLIFVSLTTQRLSSGIAGGLSHKVVVAGERLVLHVVIARDYAYNDRIVVTMAHEFRHAVEVLEHSDARNEAKVDALYRRIGYVTGAGVVETEAALEMGRLVAEELKQDAKSKRR